MNPRIDLSCLGLPDDKHLSFEGGLVENNHHYQDLRWMGFDDYDRIKAAESILLPYTDEGGDLGSDEVSKDFCDNAVYQLGLDAGVASSVAALRAAGAVLISSCAGGPGHRELHPLVAFWATQEHLPLILAAADEVGVPVESISPIGVLVYTLGDKTLMLDFADILIKRVATRE